jgi:glycosyltransferase involved in cell wall biosynthesis/peptidoglycan/xylan/chitin deacetylase (PgdA/CDA1 family)
MSEYHFQTHAVPGAGQAAFGQSGAADDPTRPRPLVLMVGMHLTRTRGGITTLARQILDSSLSASYDVRYIPSQAEDLGPLRKLLLAAVAYARFIVASLFDRPALAYVHVGSNASLYRESLFILLARLMRLPVLAHFHAGDIDEYLACQPATGKLFIRKALAASDRLIAVSRRSAAQLMALGDPLDIVILPNAIDTGVFQPRRSEHDDGSIGLLFIGATGKLKGERDLVHALARLEPDAARTIRASFLGYGAENLRPLCEEAGITSMIGHLGPVSMADRLRFFERADIFVLPTYAEAMPVSVIEAMAAGLAIVTTPVGGIPELIDDGENGVLFPAGDVNALAACIAGLVDNAERRRELGRRARDKVLREMDIDQYTARLIGTIGSTIAERHPTGARLAAKRAIKTAAASLGPVFFERSDNENAVTILAWHRVVADIRRAEREVYHGLVVSTDTFRRQCELVRETFDIVPLEEAAEHLAARRSSTRPLAVLTFDDGYADFYDQAFPVLHSMDLPATMFLPTSFVGTGRLFDHDRLFWLLGRARENGTDIAGILERAGVPEKKGRVFVRSGDPAAHTETLVHLPMATRARVIAELESAATGTFPSGHGVLAWSQIREMAAAGISFGAHTANHIVLTAESAEDARSEISESKLVLEKQLGAEVTTFAYPNGEYSPAIRQMVEDAGFRIAVTTRRHINRPGSDLLALGRISLCEESTRGITGVYSNRVARLRLGV